LARDLFVAAYVGGGVQSQREGEGLAFLRVSTDVIAKPLSWLNVRLGYEHRASVGVARSPYGIGYAEARAALVSRYDFRVRTDWDKRLLTTIGVGFYW
jgi:hypothetical protein